MIRHIVTWKLTAEDAADKAAAVAEIKAALEPLAEVIPGIASLAVSANGAYFDTNWDAVIVADFESLDALDAYQVHPQHVAAAAIVRSHVSGRAAIDFEL